jgi:hypothetical protein
MLSVTNKNLMLSAIMLSPIMLSVIMLSVLAPNFDIKIYKLRHMVTTLGLVL